ncbi:MAG: cytidine deaminase [Sphingomonadales bacterium]|nr:cytidine deaminase [Sphingomonadales bacterium]
MTANHPEHPADPQPNRDRLIAAARAAAAHAHAPYSRFGVGAALLLDDDSIVTGCNFENASYGLTLCAETVALASANAAGQLRRVTEIGIVGGVIVDGAIAGDAPVRPCGRCRQVINEAGQLAKRDIVVHCASADGGTIETHRLSDLLPLPFGPADLGMA